MNTKVVKIEDKEPVDTSKLIEAAAIIQGGGLVAFPTETVYGLGGNALEAQASGKIYAAKGRPSDNPLIAHIADIKGMEDIAEHVPDQAYKLAEAYWPGPMTMILTKNDKVPYETTGGLDTVAIRMPSDPIARALIKLSGVPIAAPSANTSGRPSPTKASHVIDDMDGKIDMVIDGGEVGIGVESTIVDLTGDKPMILRPGAITQEMLKEVVGDVGIDPALMRPMADGVHPKAPGMKYRHYAPRAALTLVDGDMDAVVKTINLEVTKAIDKNQRVGIIATDETMHAYPLGIVRSIGSRSDENTVAHNLYAVLREYDDMDVDIIYSESFDTEGIGYAIMNRLTKAAGYHTIHVL